MASTSTTSTAQSLIDVFARIGDAAFVVDRTSRIVLWNDGMEALLGFPASEVLGRHCYEIVAGRDSFCRRFCSDTCTVMACFRNSKPVQNYDILTSHRDGRDVWTNVSIVAVPNSDGEPEFNVHVLRDVTAHRHKEQILDGILKQLEERLVHTSQAREPAPPDRAYRHPVLTEREHEVLELLSTGLGAKDIAKKLQISRCTTRNHIQSILTKVGVHSTSQAVAYAYQHRLLDPPSS
ncbi:MAG: PAS domain-containing protein [Chloroflexi bacterium]|nr:PAS domain-containing protein [Chloroflexota bacterium]